MDNKKSTNIAFIILILLLLISALKTQKSSLNLAEAIKGNIPELSGIEYGSSSAKDNAPQVVLKDFDTVPPPRKINRSIDRATAMKYIQTRSLNGTEMLALTKIPKINPHLNKNKKIVIYINKGSERDVQAFIKEFKKSREKYSSNPNFVFIPLETLWDLKEDNIKNSHDRVVYNLKQDCGRFCILDLRGEKLIRLKGSHVSKKSAEIVGVVLNSL